MRRLVALFVGFVCVFGGTALAGAQPRAADKPAATVVALQGVGYLRSKVFRASSHWRLDWSFDCSNVRGGSDFFVVNVVRTANERQVIGIVNEAGKRGSGTAAPPFAEPIWLDIVSPCKWSARVVDPGAAKAKT
ncbi:MAG: hypothetical protein JO036_12335 [Candidatus Eremiobacteraeota bacterium]|nr:hypothetical protein [Candidatus Eremiobacteraeota bacterium]